MWRKSRRRALPARSSIAPFRMPGRQPLGGVVPPEQLHGFADKLVNGAGGLNAQVADDPIVLAGDIDAKSDDIWRRYGRRRSLGGRCGRRGRVRCDGLVGGHGPFLLPRPFMSRLSSYRPRPGRVSTHSETPLDLRDRGDRPQQVGSPHVVIRSSRQSVLAVYGPSATSTRSTRMLRPSGGPTVMTAPTIRSVSATTTTRGTICPETTPPSESMAVQPIAVGVAAIRRAVRPLTWGSRSAASSARDARPNSTQSLGCSSRGALLR